MNEFTFQQLKHSGKGKILITLKVYFADRFIGYICRDLLVHPSDPTRGMKLWRAIRWVKHWGILPVEGYKETRESAAQTLLEPFELPELIYEAEDDEGHFLRC